METFGVGAVLNYGGYWLGFLTVLLLGIAAGFNHDERDRAVDSASIKIGKA